MTSVTPPPSSGLTLEKLRAFANFLPEWNTLQGWPDRAPLSLVERNIVSDALWKEQEITWLRVLGTILNHRCQRQSVQACALIHFNWFPTDVERMFRYWIQSRHLKSYGMHLLQCYQALKAGATYPALAGLTPLVEAMLREAGYPDRNYKGFFDSFADGIGTQSAKLYTEYFYKNENELRSGVDDRLPLNRHLVLHGESVDSIYPLVVIGTCMVLDMVVSTDATGGKLLSRILDYL